MSEKTLRQLVGALAVVVAIWLIVSFVSGVGGGGSIAASGEITRFFQGVDGESLESARLTRREEAISLERAEEGWRVNGFPADSGSVSRFLAAVDEAEVRDLVASNPQNHDRMGVSDDSATVVELTAAGSTRTMLVGKSGRAYGTAYARLPGADEVYLLDGDLRAQVVRGVDDWRNRTLVAIDTAAVVRVEIDREGASYALQRGDSAWVFESGGAADATAVNGVLSELSRLVATGFLSESDSIAALQQASSTRAYSESGDLLAEITIGSGSGDRWARTASDDYLYRISSFRAGRVAPSREDADPDS